jgi:hypothetical protein
MVVCANTESETTIPQTRPSSSQALPYNPSGSMEKRILQVNSFHPTHHSTNDTMTGKLSISVQMFVV